MNQNVEFFLKRYNTARIDIKNFGKKDNNIEIIEKNDLNLDIIQPSWFDDSSGVGTQIHSDEGILDLKIKCINDGELRITLRSMDVRDRNGKRFPIYIDYTKFYINGECIFDSRISVSHDMCYNYIKDDVKDGEIIDMHIEWEPFDQNSLYRG